MISVSTNAGPLARRFQVSYKAMDAALLGGLKKAASEVDREQVRNLSGGKDAAAGSYPVPNRTGNLFKSHFFAVRSIRLAVVGNTAAYALPIHEGESAGRSGIRINPRPFLDDAVLVVRPTELAMQEISRRMLAS